LVLVPFPLDPQGGENTKWMGWWYFGERRQQNWIDNEFVKKDGGQNGDNHKQVHLGPRVGCWLLVLTWSFFWPYWVLVLGYDIQPPNNLAAHMFPAA
jgi:hypothetical protein